MILNSASPNVSLTLADLVIYFKVFTVDSQEEAVGEQSIAKRTSTPTLVSIAGKSLVTQVNTNLSPFLLVLCRLSIRTPACSMSRTKWRSSPNGHQCEITTVTLAKTASAATLETQLQLLTRHGIDDEEAFKPQPFALIVTISDPEKKAPVYNEMAQITRNRFQSQNLTVRAAARVRAKQ
jgi:hypothetical protein